MNQCEKYIKESCSVNGRHGIMFNDRDDRCNDGGDGR